MYIFIFKYPYFSVIQVYANFFSLKKLSEDSQHLGDGSEDQEFKVILGYKVQGQFGL